MPKEFVILAIIVIVIVAMYFVMNDQDCNNPPS
jgi:hypothetical protein